MASELVIVVDDDRGMRSSLSALLEALGYRGKSFASALAFLADDPSSGSCMIVDVRMPEMDGLTLQEEINKRGYKIPVIIMTGHGDVPLAVRAMKAGAVDFLEKPSNDDTLLASVRRAIDIGVRARDRAAEAKAAQDLLEQLTPRE